MRPEPAFLRPAGVSALHDRAQRSAVTAVPRTQPRLIAIASGKGGVGKTWLTLSLAQAMSARGARVLVLDADFGLANADIQLGHLAESDIGAVLRNEASLADSIVRVGQGGFDLLAGEAGSGTFSGLDPVVIERLVGSLLDAKTRYDIVLLDLGTGVEPASRHLAALADTLVLISTGDPASLTDGYAVLKLLQRDRADRGAAVDARIVINQIETEPAGRRAHAALARAARGFLRLDPPLLGIIQRDDNIGEAIRGQRLFLSEFPQSPTAAVIQSIARRLLAK
ncbi:MAG: hypothetical protein B7Z76_04900 [Acidiphilium sp. 20-67-58]|jgi:flagellar biosynthesis protein FlhG|nr:MAG: hypothetical protein B7Z76_04900 [Acidiphilium sp. 20-67-58]